MNQKLLVSLVLSTLLLAACTPKIPSTDTMMKKDEPTKIMEKPGSMMQKQSYLAYSPATFEANKDQKRILFFKANWCPTCNTADKDFTDNIIKIPEGTTLYQVDYDKETELKKKYAITYQHTFVQVDEKGNEIFKWNGGGIDKLLVSIK